MHLKFELECLYCCMRRGIWQNVLDLLHTPAENETHLHSSVAHGVKRSPQTYLTTYNPNDI